MAEAKSGFGANTRVSVKVKVEFTSIKSLNAGSTTKSLDSDAVFRSSEAIFIRIVVDLELWL